MIAVFTNALLAFAAYHFGDPALTFGELLRLAIYATGSVLMVAIALVDGINYLRFVARYGYRPLPLTELHALADNAKTPDNEAQSDISVSEN